MPINKLSADWVDDPSLREVTLDSFRVRGEEFLRNWMLRCVDPVFDLKIDIGAQYEGDNHKKLIGAIICIHLDDNDKGYTFDLKEAEFLSKFVRTLGFVGEHAPNMGEALDEAIKEGQQFEPKNIN